MNQTDSQAIKEFKEKLQHLLGKDLEKVALFGSKAEGRDRWDSDIDLAVLIKDSALPLRDGILDAAFEVNLKYGVYISPRVLTLSTYNHPVWRITPFLKRIRESAIPL